MDFKTEFGIVPLNQINTVGEATAKSSSIVPVFLMVGGALLAGYIIYKLVEKKKERDQDDGPRIIYRE